MYHRCTSLSKVVHGSHCNACSNARRLRGVRDTTGIGNLTEGMVLAALLRAGHKPLLPFGGGHPYDLAFDHDGELKRVQCKTGRYLADRGVVAFSTAIWTRAGDYRSYKGDVDYFGVYCPDTQEVYLVPIGDVPDRGAHLRIAAPKNQQYRGMRWAEDYVLGARKFVLPSGVSGRGRNEGVPRERRSAVPS